MAKVVEPERVLHIVSAMERGGAEMLIMNIYRNLDRTKLQFDFITHSKGEFDDEIISLGGRIKQVSSLGEIGPIKYIKVLKRIMSSSNYLAVHSHTDFQSGFPALAAKLSGINKRICHSHSNNWPKKKSLKDKLIFKLLQTIIRVSATNYCSCSEEAAEFLFGKRVVKRGKVNIMNNGIDLKLFITENNSRDSVLAELRLPKDVITIGHVGRFSQSKNQVFILKLLKSILETDPNYVVLFVGDGPLKKQVEKEAEALGLLRNTRFLGIRTDIARLMKAFDVFVFPSLFEGFGIVALEAQCAGTPCVVADTVPQATDMGLNLMSFVSLDEELKEWSNLIKRSTEIKRPEGETIYNHFIKKGFSIQDNIPKWISLYYQGSKSKGAI